MAAYLASDAPAPQRFALDTGFAPGAASLDAAGTTAVRGIAGVMTEHLNTKIKLAASGGGLALRRAAAIKRRPGRAGGRRLPHRDRCGARADQRRIGG